MDWLFTFADPTIDWNYAMITLIVRFIGVFFVMAAMQVALQVSSRVIQRMEAPASAPAAPVAAPVPSTAPAATVADDGVDEATAAAIGLALALESRPAAVAADTATTPWAAAGRINQLNRLPR